MKITIDIPKEFEDHWKDDKFEDSLNRLKADAHCLAWNYEKEIVDMLIVAFKNATDAVDIVRCKDCKWCEKSVFAKYLNANEVERCYCDIHKHYTNGEYYCATGERRDNAD